MDEDVEAEEGEEEVVGLGPGQLRLLQVHREKQAEDAKDVGRVA